MFDDPEFREVALARIRTLSKLAEDLEDIVRGTKPTAVELESAVVLQGALLSERTVPCMIGMAHGQHRTGKPGHNHLPTLLLPIPKAIGSGHSRASTA